MQGLFLVNKPRGISSRAIGTSLKKILNLGKVGHVGTLDQEASGLLMILSESATRLQNYFLSTSKVYAGTILLGVSSDTDDVFGVCSDTLGAIDVLKELNLVRATKQIKESFSPSYDQIPAMVSSKKVKGVNARVLVSQGIVPDLAAKKVDLNFLRLEFEGYQRLQYEIEVSSGFYVRALARDIGQMLGVGGVAENIIRTSVGPFILSNATKFEVVDEEVQCSGEELKNGFIPLGKFADYLGFLKVILDEEETKQFRTGNKKILEKFVGVEDGKISVVDNSENLIGIVSILQGVPKFEVVLD